MNGDEGAVLVFSVIILLITSFILGNTFGYKRHVKTCSNAAVELNLAEYNPKTRSIDLTDKISQELCK